MTRSLPFVLVALAVAGAAAQPALPPALVAMADAERAFARAAAEKGIRDAFLEYLAEDSVSFTPDPAPARAPLLAQPSRPASERELRWEPRTGDVAASGELGWLTGPSTFINHAAAAPEPHHGNYLSIWRQQPDGRWRVYVDVGVSQPAPVRFPEGLTRTTVATHFAGDEPAGAASASLEAADRALNAAISRDGAAAAYGARVVDGSRLHRDGVASPVGPTAIGAWLRAQAGDFRATTAGAAAARSGDLGYAHGSYTGGAAAQTGAYVRVWARLADGTWKLMADVTQRLDPR
jgi:ketosteroid isomerase-like protein